jgi:regulator of protease activity HflC (stomatin/prohibitin superfamily)
MSEQKNFSNLRHNSPTVDNLDHLRHNEIDISHNLSVTYQVEDSYITTKSIDDNYSNLESSLDESLRRDIKEVIADEEFSSVKHINDLKMCNYESENLDIKELLESKNTLSEL